MKMSLRSEVEVDYSRGGGSLLHGMSKFLKAVLCKFFTQASVLRVPQQPSWAKQTLHDDTTGYSPCQNKCSKHMNISSCTIISSNNNEYILSRTQGDIPSCSLIMEKQVAYNYTPSKFYTGQLHRPWPVGASPTVCIHICCTRSTPFPRFSKLI